MIHPIQSTSRQTQRLGRVALTALVLGLGAAALVVMPLDNLAFAGNGNGNGGGKGGGNGGGHGGGNGGGKGHDGGNGNGNGNGNGKGGSSGSSAKAGKSSVGSTDDSADDGADDSLAAQNLGKLNGFFHASSSALANASPNSAIGRISHTFKDALSGFAATSEADPSDPDAAPPSGPSIDDLGAILAGATNKTVTAAQVGEIIDRLAEQNPDDAALGDLADSVDEGTLQDIADAANAAKSADTTDDAVDEGGAGTAGSDEAAGDTGAPVTSATN